MDEVALPFGPSAGTPLPVLGSALRQISPATQHLFSWPVS